MSSGAGSKAHGLVDRAAHRRTDASRRVHELDALNVTWWRRGEQGAPL